MKNAAEIRKTLVLTMLFNSILIREAQPLGIGKHNAAILMLIYGQRSSQFTKAHSPTLTSKIMKVLPKATIDGAARALIKSGHMESQTRELTKKGHRAAQQLFKTMELKAIEIAPHIKAILE